MVSYFCLIMLFFIKFNTHWNKCDCLINNNNDYILQGWSHEFLGGQTKLQLTTAI